jgi:hypothetical protein
MAPGEEMFPNWILPEETETASELPAMVPAPAPVMIPLIELSLRVTALVPPLTDTFPAPLLADIVSPMTVIWLALLKPKLILRPAVKLSPFEALKVRGFPVV